VRLLFCLFADDTGIFPQGSFFRYLEDSRPDGSDMSGRIGRLFEILNMPEDERAKRPLIPEELLKFRYVNGGLFAEALPTADFDAKTSRLLLDCADFRWAAISPAVFGAMFQGVMDKARRRELGAHYTGEENILKLINPLFMDDLWREFDRIKTDPPALEAFLGKISSFSFLDPACGCGNFLIITYRELRLLELEILKLIGGNRLKALGLSFHRKVSLEQFHGMEKEDFPCQIARVGMWLTDHQMNQRLSEQLGKYYVRLPLTEGAKIACVNALRTDWETVMPKGDSAFILGNPPFAGSKMQSAAQRREVEEALALACGGERGGTGTLDYVAGWYFKAARFMEGTAARAAFVSTNSITQGEQASALWKPLIRESGVKIDFARRSFRWDNEAKGRAAVYCVIVGFSMQGVADKAICQENNETATQGVADKALYLENGEMTAARNINPYLVDAPDVFIGARRHPLCQAPEMGIGNKPIDGGNYLFTESEKAEFLEMEPQAEKRFRPWIGSDEFINGYRRYCLWLGDCPPDELRRMPEAKKRVEAVRLFRRRSSDAQTRKLADFPRRFHVENLPRCRYLVIPELSSERRRYVPIGFLGPDVMCSSLVRIMPGAGLYHFGILASCAHNAWIRAVGGRFKMSYRYSIRIVYNNFPWPPVTSGRKEEIEALSRRVLDERGLFPGCSLADLYDPDSMPPRLLKAHQDLDRSVAKAYGFPDKDADDAAWAAMLMERYRLLDGAVGGGA
jgi:hypothetical protein